MRHARKILVALLVPVLATCTDVTEPIRGEIELESLQFFSGITDVGAPLLLMAEARGDGSETAVAIDPRALTVQSSSGSAVKAGLQSRSPYREGARETPWAQMSDEELTQAIAHATRDIVGIGFREADADRGVDENGRVLCSEETEAEMKAWLVEQGISIEREPLYLPAVWATMPADLDLVRQIRYHPNVDYMFPNTTGEYVSTGTAPASLEGPGAWFVAVVNTSSDGESGLRVGSGDEVTATYRQPDGSVLTATTRIR